MIESTKIEYVVWYDEGKAEHVVYLYVFMRKGAAHWAVHCLVEEGLVEEVCRFKHQDFILDERGVREKYLTSLPADVVCKLLENICNITQIHARQEQERLVRAEMKQPYIRVAAQLGINIKEATELLAGLSFVDQLSLAQELEELVYL